MVYYKGKNGRYFTEKDLETAYCLVTGKQRNDDSYCYNGWLNGLKLGAKIERVNEEEIILDASLAKNQRVLAVLLYRQRNGCSLREADEAVRNMTEEA